MSQWQIVSIVALLAWLVLAIRGLRSHRFDANIVLRSILIWGAIVLVVTAIVVNRQPIADALAPVRGMMP